MRGGDYTAWHKPRSGTIFKLEEVNHPINTGRYPTHNVETVIEKLTTARENLVKAEAEIRNKMQAAITSTDLYDRPVPVRIQELMSKLGISFEEYKETDLQPVVDLVNWALVTPKLPMTEAEEVKHKQSSVTELRKYMVSELVELMSPENQPWHLPDAIQAVVAALLTLHDRDLIFMELRKFINPSCN